MSEVPKLRMLELDLCRNHYAATDPTAIGRDGSVPEHFCKIQEIQSALTTMRGIIGMIEGIPGLILAVSYGLLADSKGRRLVTGLSLTFPVRAVYAAPVFLVLRGGSTIISPMIMAIIAAAIPEASRDSDSVATDEEEEIRAANAQHLDCLTNKSLWKEKALHGVSNLLQMIRHRTLWHKSLIIGLLALIVAKMAHPMLKLILQYMSVRFEWPLSKLNPWLLARMEMSSAASLVLTRLSIVFLAFGSFFMGLGTNAPAFIVAFLVYTLGNGFASTLRSLMKTMVHPYHISLLFTAIAVFEGISTIGASPLLGL
ncbi:hypothetical protein FGRMN_6866 [Fusarium graminum]|nr:hypothetical protein FGRMN_6866 [Fusarium graminum]